LNQLERNQKGKSLVLTLVGVENDKVAVQNVLVGRVKCVGAQENLMLDAKEVFVGVASSWSTSYKQQYLVCLWKGFLC
jgi:hypothetical protein